MLKGLFALRVKPSKWKKRLRYSNCLFSCVALIHFKNITPYSTTAFTLFIGRAAFLLHKSTQFHFLCLHFLWCIPNSTSLLTLSLGLHILWCILLVVRSFFKNGLVRSFLNVIIFTSSPRERNYDQSRSPLGPIEDRWNLYHVINSHVWMR